jgi:hypothetical protein
MFNSVFEAVDFEMPRFDGTPCNLSMQELRMGNVPKNQLPRRNFRIDSVPGAADGTSRLLWISPKCLEMKESRFQKNRCHDWVRIYRPYLSCLAWPRKEVRANRRPVNCRCIRRARDGMSNTSCWWHAQI